MAEEVLQLNIFKRVQKLFFKVFPFKDFLKDSLTNLWTNNWELYLHPLRSFTQHFFKKCFGYYHFFLNILTIQYYIVIIFSPSSCCHIHTIDDFLAYGNLQSWNNSLYQRAQKEGASPVSVYHGHTSANRMKCGPSFQL